MPTEAEFEKACTDTATLEWGSEDQIDAQNRMWEILVELGLSEETIEEACIKADTDDMVEHARRFYKELTHAR